LLCNPWHSERGNKAARALESIFEQDSCRKIHTDRESELVIPNIKKDLLTYNTILCHSHSLIKTAWAERLTRTIQLLMLKYFTLKILLLLLNI